MKAGKKYISWTVDSPMLTMYHDSVYNPCNYIFIFDKFNYMQFKAMELNHVYYLPLAVDSERLEHLLENTKPDEKEKSAPIFHLSEDCMTRIRMMIFMKCLPPYLRGYFDSAFRAQLDIFGDNIFDRILTPDILAELSECVDFRQDENSFSDIKLIFTNTFLGYKMAQTERIECLNLLAKAAKVDLYTDDLAKDRLRNVIIRGTVSYFNDMPKVFAASKINMNFTIRNIRSGIPLRVWERAWCGGSSN